MAILLYASGLQTCRHNGSPFLSPIADDKERDLIAEDKEGIVLALQHYDKVRSMPLVIPFPKLQRLIIMEYLMGLSCAAGLNTFRPYATWEWNFPKQSKHHILRHFLLINVSGSPLLTLPWPRHTRA